MKNKIKYSIILSLIILLVSSCVIDLDEYTRSNSSIQFNHIWDGNQVYLKSKVILGLDTLKIEKLEYVISDIKLISDIDTIYVKNHALIKLNTNLSIGDVSHNIYKLVFTFGLKNIDKDYYNLNAQNFNTEDNDGYYFLKFEGGYNQSTEYFNYHIAKKLNTNYINSYLVEIEGFNITLNFVNEAVINVNLKNLFSSPNSVNLEDLTPSLIQDSLIHSQLMENAKNIFYLDRFVHD